MRRSTAVMLRIALSVLTALSLVHLVSPRSLAEPTERTRLLKVLPDGQEVHVRRVTTFEIRTAEQAGVPEWEGMWQIDHYLLEVRNKTGSPSRVAWRFSNGFPTDSTKILKSMKVFDVLDANWDDKFGTVLVARPPHVWVFRFDAATGRTVNDWTIRRIPADRDYTLRCGRILGDDRFSLVLPDGTTETWALKYTGNEMYDDGKEAELVSREASRDPTQSTQDAGSQGK